MKIKPREPTLIYSTPEGTFAEKWGRAIRVDDVATSAESAGTFEFEAVSEEPEALNKLFGIDAEMVVIDEAQINDEDVLNKPLTKQAVFDINQICNNLRNGSARNERRAIKKAYNKRIKK